MYIKRSEATIDAGALEETKTSQARVHEFMRNMPGFRWAMLLRSVESPEKVAAVSMWLSPEQASDQDGDTLGANEVTHGYDVATARGSMTPASHIAVVDWHIDEALVSRFTNRWNAQYHAIEDRIGSRLLRDLEASGQYAGLHAVTDEAKLDAGTLGAAVTDAEGMSLTPGAIHRYEVVLLTES